MKKNTFKQICNLLQGTGVEAALFLQNGAKEAETAPFVSVLPAFPAHGEILQPAGLALTLTRVHGDMILALSGTGEAFYNYASMLRSALEMGADGPLTMPERLKQYLLGEGDADAQALAASFPDRFDAYVLTLVPDSVRSFGQLKNYLEAMRAPGDLVLPLDDKAIAFIKTCGGEDDYRSANDFAFTLYDSINEELRIKLIVNVGGTVHGFNELKTVFHRCAFAYNYGKLMAPGEKIYSYKEYIMLKMLSDIPAESLSSYLNTILDRDGRKILEDPELMETAEQFLKNSLNISETSRIMYMHRNTLIYRLDKIENATGLNLRRFNDAVVFHLLTMLKKLVKKKD